MQAKNDQKNLGHEKKIRSKSKRSYSASYPRHLQLIHYHHLLFEWSVKLWVIKILGFSVLFVRDRGIISFTFFFFFAVRFYRGFPKVDHSGRSARIVLEQINSAKKKPSSNRTWTLDPRTAHFLSPMPYPCARSHCLKDWDFNDPYVVMLYWFFWTWRNWEDLSLSSNWI